MILLIAIAPWIQNLLILLLVLMFLGFLHVVIGKAPLISPTLKSILQWVLWIIGGLVCFDYLWTILNGHHLWL